MDPRFQKELEQLRVKVLQMAAYTERALDRAMGALKARDSELARQVIDSDNEINAMECEVDTLSLRLLALDQPVAMDLRFIVACMRLVVDLERVGDEAVNIAEQVLLLARLPFMPYARDIEVLSGQVTGMFRDAIHSFRDQNPDLARQVCSADALADELNMKVLKQSMDTNGAACEAVSLDRSIRMVMVSRSMERIGDLATNIAESTIFVARGVSIKHHCQPL